MSISTDIVRLSKDRKIVIRSDGSIDFRIQTTSKYAAYRHRHAGPAVIRADGTIKYFVLGIHHREDGPATIYANNVTRYIVNGVILPKEEYFIKFGVM